MSRTHIQEDYPMHSLINILELILTCIVEISTIIRVLNTYVISKFYRILYLSQSRLIFLSNFEIYLLYGDVRY